MSGTEQPAATDGSFVPRINPAVAEVELDGERVLYDTEQGWLYQLDAVGSVTWSCFDGESSIDEVAADLAEAFGADATQVRYDVAALAADLVAKGLLFGANGSVGKAGTVSGDHGHDHEHGRDEETGATGELVEPGRQPDPDIRLLTDPPSG